MQKSESRVRQAPDPLDLVQRFVNTRNLMRGYDLFDSRAQATEWLERSGYASKDTIGDADLTRLRELREWLRDILLSHNDGESVDTVTVSRRLSDLVDDIKLGVRFDTLGDPHLVSSHAGMRGLMQDLLIAAVSASADGTWQRLKACANEECQCAFYDASRNRSGSWCVMEICGSRSKMRSYRKRQSGRTRTPPDP